MAYRGEAEFEDTVYSPVVQFALATGDDADFSLAHRMSMGITARLDIFEYVPYVSGRLGVTIDDAIEPHGNLSLGINRVYQDGWFFNFELGAEQYLSRQGGSGGIILFGFGSTYNLDELV